MMTVPVDYLWSSPPAGVVLSSEDVHVWSALLDQPMPLFRKLAETLSVDEWMRGKRYYTERDRTRFVVRRGVLRMLLGRYLDVEPHQIQFRYGPYGKPVLAWPAISRHIHFNLSHSDGLGLYAVTRDRQIGVDVERVRPLPDAEQIALHFFSPRENAALHALSSNERQEAFFNCWTRKEAYLKATGGGLACPLNTFEVSLTPGEPTRLLSNSSDPQELTRWSLQTLTPAPGYVAALAIMGNSLHVACWHWSE
jgi:4'-phosphopantetheinyl transferase